MTDTSKQELIEAAEVAIREAWTHRSQNPSVQTGLAECAAAAALAVFEQAHTPTDDERGVPGFAEREKRASRAWEFFSRDDRKMSHEFRGGYHQGVIDGFRRTAAQEPSIEPPCEHEWQNRVSGGSKCTKCHLWQDKRVPQGEPTPVRFVARQGAKSQTTIDALLAQANEHGIRVEVVYPQGEPTDAQVKAASNAYMHYKPPYDDLSAFSVAFLDDMRAALRAAAAEVRGEER